MGSLPRALCAFGKSESTQRWITGAKIIILYHLTISTYCFIMDFQAEIEALSRDLSATSEAINEYESSVHLKEMRS